MKKGEKMTDEQKLVLKQKLADGRAAAKEKREAAKSEAKADSLGEVKDNIDEMAEPYFYVEPEKVKEIPKPRVPSHEIQFFTEEDYNPKGKVANDFPAYYFRAELRELVEDAKTHKKNIDMGVFTGKRLEDARDRLKAMETKIDKIVNGRPKLAGIQKDKFARSFKNLHEGIKETRFKYDEMWKQTIDAQDEADRMEGHCVKIQDEIVASYVRQKGYPVKDGKITRNVASIIAKVMGNLLEHQVKIDYRDQ